MSNPVVNPEMHSVSKSDALRRGFLLIQLAAKKFLATLMDAPIRNQKQLGTLTTLIVGGAAVAFYILRVIARLPYFGGNWGYDDWIMTLAMVRPRRLTRDVLILTGRRCSSSQRLSVPISVSKTT